MAETEISKQTNKKDLTHEDIAKLLNLPLSHVESFYFLKNHPKRLDPKLDKIKMIINNADKDLLDKSLDEITEKPGYIDLLASVKIKHKKYKKRQNNQENPKNKDTKK